MAADGPYAWGYCFVTEQGNPPDYCDGNQQQRQQYPCAAGKKYFGRGPIQITHHYNYGPAGTAIKSNLLANPDLVATDPIISFKTAFWFWMTPQSPKPSSHDVITGRWTPSPADSAAGRVPGYGVITNIINGGIECGKGSTREQEDRIGFYKRYSGIMGVGLVADDATISFRAALWLWMTPQSPKLSCHDVITGQWTPSAANSVAGRVPRYGVITNIFNGGIEFLMHFNDIMGVGYGDNLGCNNQRPFG
ncbi:hypothetical protein C3L33_17850, partial [Rhododendron williamsianum]